MKLSLKINKKRLRNALLFGVVSFALIKPDSLEYIGFAWLENVLIGIDGLFLVYLSLLALEKKYRISAMTIAIILLFASLLPSTLFISKDIFTWVKMAGPTMAVCMWVDYSMQKNPEKFLSGTTYMLLICYAINLYTIIRFPGGMYNTSYNIGDNYFMGFDNHMIANLLPMCGYAMLLEYYRKKKKIDLLISACLIITLVSEVLIQSGTGLVMTLLMVIFYLIARKNENSMILSPIFMFVSFYVITILLVFFRAQNLFAGIIVNYLNKDLTLTGRIYLWDYALSVIKDNWLIGIGVGGRTVAGLNGHYYPHPHCLLLDLLYKGGIVTLVLFVIINILFSKNCKKCGKSYISNIIIMVEFTYLLSETVNSSQYKIFFWATFVLMQYSNTLMNNQDRMNDNTSKHQLNKQ